MNANLIHAIQILPWNPKPRISRRNKSRCNQKINPSIKIALNQNN